MSTLTPPDLRNARDWAKVFRILDSSCLPANGRLTSPDQLVVRPAAYWQESWLPRFDRPDELITVAVFETRLAIALRASNHNRS